MACNINIQMTVYGTDGGSEKISVPVGTVEEEQQISIDDVVTMITNLSKESRETLAKQLIRAARQNITAEMLQDHRFVSNITVDGLFSLFPNLSGLYKVNPDLYTHYTIVKGSNFKINNVNYNGRVITANGQEVFFIKDYQGAAKFLRYLQAKEMAESAFGGDQIPENLQSTLAPFLEDLDIIVSHYNAIKPGEVTQKMRLDTIITHLNDYNEYKPFRYDGRVITPRQVFGRLVGTLANEYNFDDNYTDLELALDGIRNRKVAGYNWVFNKKTLYKTLSVYYPEFAEAYSESEFNKLNAAQLQSLLLGPGGPFEGNPKLQKAIITENEGTTTIKEPKEPTTTLTDRVSQGKIKEAWESIWGSVVEAAKAHGVQLSKKYSEYEKLEPEVMAQIFNSINYQYVGKDGQPHTVKAEVTTNKNGKRGIRYSYEYTVVNEPVEVITGNTITLEFPYSSIGEIYNFGYDGSYIFSPVNEENVTDGKFKGMYMYKATMSNGRTVYAISRSIISPNSFMETYPSLEAAKHGIEEKNKKDTILENSLITIKQAEGTPRTSLVEMDKVKDGQILSVLNIKLPNIQVNKLPGVFQQLMSLTVPEFQEHLKGVRNINLLDTPEKAAAFIMRIAHSFTVEEIKATRSANAISSLTKILKQPKFGSIISGIINEINSAPSQHYFIEKLAISNPNQSNMRKIAVLKLLENGGTSINLEGTLVGDTTTGEFIDQTMTQAIEFFNSAYGLKINRITRSELEQLSMENKLGLESRLDSIKAFIYNGEIYINTSNCKISDLYHEVAHIFFGVLKSESGYQAGYEQIMNEYRTGDRKRRFDRKFVAMQSSYPNLARQDLIEEVVVDMIGEDLMNNGDLSGAIFNQGYFNDLMKNIIGKVDQFNKDLISNGMGFDQFMKTLIDKNSSSLKIQRVLTNLVQQMITDKKIAEIDC